MNTTSYICFNGKLYSKNSHLVNSENRALRYGDSLFETIHSNGTDVQFLSEHLNRLIEGMRILNMKVPIGFRQTINNDISYLINKNKSFTGNRIRLTVYRNNGGLYTPSDNSISYIIENTPLEESHYELNKKGLKIGVYRDVKKNYSIISKLKTGNSLPFIMAGMYKNKMRWDDCLILNDRGNVVESVSSNLFIVKDEILMTPSLESGAVAGIMREQVIQAALRMGITTYEDCLISENEIKDADEIFLTNAIQGIRWVVAYQERRFFNRTSKLIVEEINKKCFDI
jgi:branched-chain amino acid aminotransferase